MINFRPHLAPFRTEDICRFRQYIHCPGPPFHCATCICGSCYIPGQCDSFHHIFDIGQADQPHLGFPTPFEASLQRRGDRLHIQYRSLLYSAACASLLLLVGVLVCVYLLYAFLRLTIYASCKLSSLNCSPKVVLISALEVTSY